MNILKEYFADNHKIIIVDAFLKIDELSITDVAVLSKIIMLSDNPNGGCMAGNILFADFLNVSEDRIGKIINKLNILKYVTLSKTLDTYGHKVRLITPILATILDKTGKKVSLNTEKNGINTEKYSTKNTSQSHTSQWFSPQKYEVGQKNRRKQKNIRTEERQTHEQKTVNEIDWTDFDSNASSDSALTFCVSDFSDSQLVKKLEEHMHTTQAYGLIRKFGTQKVEIALNKVNNRNPANKGGYLMAMLTKGNETPTVKDKAAKDDKAKKEQLSMSEHNWKAINRWLNLHNKEMQQFYQDLIDRKISSGKLTHEVKTLLLKHQTGLINKPFDITFANRSVSINALRGYLHPEVLQSAATN